MSQKEIKELWGNSLYKIFKEHIDKDGWLTAEWSKVIEDEVPKWDQDFNDNPAYKNTYQKMYYIDFEYNEDETKIKPKN